MSEQPPPADGLSADDVLAGIRDVARNHLDFDGSLTPGEPLVAALRLDSVRMLILVAELENHFEVYLEEGDEQGLITVADLVVLLQRRLAGTPPPPAAP